MNYKELICTHNSSNSDIAEILIAELADIGFESFVEEASCVKAYIQENLFVSTQLEELKQKAFASHIQFEISDIKTQNWNTLKDVILPLAVPLNAFIPLVSLSNPPIS